MPKELDPSTPLLWTKQTDDLWQEVKVEPNGCSCRGQIFAGPSGMGKSHITLLLALRCYAARIPVLYVGDAGVYLKNVQLNQLPIYEALLRDFVTLNADVVPAAARCPIPLYTSFMRLLNDNKAVVTLDGHGHAYNHLMAAGLDVSEDFSLLLPVMYNDYRFIRCIFAGSNQARFESELNDRPTLRFILPFTEGEAELFIK